MNIVRCRAVIIAALFFMGFSLRGAPPSYQAMPGATMPPAAQPFPPQPGVPPPQYGQPGTAPGQPAAPGYPPTPSAPGYPQAATVPPQPGTTPGLSPTDQLNNSQPGPAGSGSGTKIALSVFAKKGDKLEKMKLDPLLKKAVVVCIGDWCPHCANFLSAFAKYVEVLQLYGINVVFLGVPSLEDLNTNREQTTSDYDKAKAKLELYGIRADSPEAESEPAGIYFVLVPDKDGLGKIGVSALPRVIGSKDSKECWSHVGEEAVQALNLSIPENLTRVLKTFDKSVDDKDTDKAATKKDGSKKKKDHAKGGKSGSKGAADSKKHGGKGGKSGPVDKTEASRLTRLLNEGKEPTLSPRQSSKQHPVSGCSCSL